MRLKYLDLADFTKAYDHVNILLGYLPDLSIPILRSGMTTMAWSSDPSRRSIPVTREVFEMPHLLVWRPGGDAFCPQFASLSYSGNEAQLLKMLLLIF